MQMRMQNAKATCKCVKHTNGYAKCKGEDANANAKCKGKMQMQMQNAAAQCQVHESVPTHASAPNALSLIEKQMH